MSLERLVEIAKPLLLIRIDDKRFDPILWEHSERVMELARWIARLPELKSAEVDPQVAAVAALFHDAGWATQYQQGRIDRWQILGRPTNEGQRELAAAMLAENGASILPAKQLREAVEIIRECNERKPESVEAQIVLEAESIDEVGLAYMLRQYRQQLSEGRSLQQLLQGWRVQKQYGYWDLRLREGFRFNATRELARRRLQTVDEFISVLESQMSATDLAAVIEPR